MASRADKKAKERKTCFYLANLSRAVSQRVFQKGIAAAIPNAILAGVIKTIISVQVEDVVAVNQFAFNSFSGLIGLFVAFRASQAYSRFWEGTNCCYMIQAEFLDVASSLMAFTRNSRVARTAVLEFRHTMVRLFSMLHVLILADLAAAGEIKGDEEALMFRVLDPMGFDQDSLLALNASEMKVDLVFQWLQSLMVEAQQKGIINVPAPIATRAFQELNAGMVHFHAALKIADVPIPFPYTVATKVVLAIHWILTPLVASGWSQSTTMCIMLAFVQVFMLWCLSFIASELENPFGVDANDLEVGTHHATFDHRLTMLLSHSHCQIPQLTTRARVDLESAGQACMGGALMMPSLQGGNLREAFRWAESLGSSGKSREELHEEFVSYYTAKFEALGYREAKAQEVEPPKYRDSQVRLYEDTPIEATTLPTSCGAIRRTPNVIVSDVNPEVAVETTVTFARTVTPCCVDQRGLEHPQWSETFFRLTNVLEKLQGQLEAPMRCSLLRHTLDSAKPPADSLADGVPDFSLTDPRALSGVRSDCCVRTFSRCGVRASDRLNSP